MPPARYCLINAPSNQLDCVDPDGTEITLSIPEADKYACLPPKDLAEIFKWIKRNCHGPTSN